MSQQGPIIIVSTAQRPSFASALDDAKIFPIIDTGWADASRAIDELQIASFFDAVLRPEFEIESYSLEKSNETTKDLRGSTKLYARNHQQKGSCNEAQRARPTPVKHQRR